AATRSPARRCTCPKSACRTSRRARNCASASTSRRHSDVPPERPSVASPRGGARPWGGPAGAPASMMGVVRWVVGAALFVALLFISLDNAEVVTLKFFRVASWQAPLVFVVLVVFVAGVAVGVAAGALRNA